MVYPRTPHTAPTVVGGGVGLVKSLLAALSNFCSKLSSSLTLELLFIRATSEVISVMRLTVEAAFRWLFIEDCIFLSILFIASGLFLQNSNNSGSVLRLSLALFKDSIVFITEV